MNSIGSRSAGGRIRGISAALLVGARSEKMACDATRAGTDGIAAATRIARLLATLFEEVLWVGGDPPTDAPGRRVPDVEGPPCPLRGLTGALEAAGGERVLVVAGDLPRVTADLLLALFAWPEADAVVPRTGDGSHPLCAIYRREAVLPVARSRLAAGDLKLRDLLDVLDARYLDDADLVRIDPGGDALTRVDTPGDLDRRSPD
ncbi:MAG: molybdenum cofactor guanylyltransferase [Myxococcota bacterium]